jgi:hypothetical protein
MQTEFEQCSDLTMRRKLSAIWPGLVDATGDFIVLFPERIVSFFLQQLNMRVQPNRYANPFVESVTRRERERQVLKIHIAAMKGIQIVVAGRFEIPSVQSIVDGLLNQLTQFDTKAIAVSALETLRIVFRSRERSSIDLVAVHKKLFQYVASKKSHEILYHVLRVLGTVGTLDPITFGGAQDQDAFARLNVWDEPVREQSYLKFVMDHVLEQLVRSSSDRSSLLNAILYIFQFDAGNTTAYLERIFGDLLADPGTDQQAESYLPPTPFSTSSAPSSRLPLAWSL